MLTRPYLLLIILLALTFIMPVFLLSQVTIGTNTIPPNSGSLLDIKQFASDSNGTNANKGLLLPRIALTVLNKFDDVISTSTPEQRTAHVGLTVYNTLTGADYGKGMYVWGGTKWMALNKKTTSGGGDNSVILDDLSNSYIIKPQTVYRLPISKAYNMWALKSEMGTTANLDDISTATVTADLLWQDEIGVIASLPAQLVDVNGEKMIEITTGSVLGNALVAIRISGDDDTAQTDKNIRWSWHLWITDYDPTTGTTYTISNGEDDFIFMDREIGAISTLEDDPRVIGLVYQWGRKDPFVTFENFSDAKTKRKLYDILGNQINTSLVDGIKLEDRPDNINNLAESAMKPDIYFKSFESWYTNSSQIEDKAVSKQLWTTIQKGTKSSYDPCPLGWRVPYDINSISPFKNIPDLPNTQSAANGTGFDFGAALGYVDGMGGRDQQGALGFKGAAFWWGGAQNGAIATTACINFIHGSGLSISEQPETTAGYVRCVKDQ